jgi:hypothetical protein
VNPYPVHYLQDMERVSVLNQGVTGRRAFWRTAEPRDMSKAGRFTYFVPG